LSIKKIDKTNKLIIIKNKSEKGFIMAVKIEQDNQQENKLNHESPNINKKFIGSADKEKSNTTGKVDLHNQIHNKFMKFVKKNRTMTTAYFKATLSVVYQDIYKKNLVWKNIEIEADIQINIKKILKDYSYVKVYDILVYYSKEAGKDMLDSKNIVEVTAMFYSTLYFFVKRDLSL
jgi:hypothetical protein